MDHLLRQREMQQERSKGYFLEFAKRKLNEGLEFNVIKTEVIVDGILVREGAEIKDDVESVESFVKIKLEGALSSSSSFGLPSADAEDKGSRHSGEDEREEIDPMIIESLMEDASNKTLPGTNRTSTRTYKTRSIQTLPKEGVEQLYQPTAVPARFEGTMLTPVYFDGLMLTPEKLDVMLNDAASKGDSLSIPVKFQGGMLTAAFKTLAENLEVGYGNAPVPVKFHGRLQGVMEPCGIDTGLPVAFDGTMVPQSKGKKATRIQE